MHRPTTSYIPLVVALFACSRDKGVDTAPVTWDLLLAVDASSSVAGQEVGYRLTAVSSQGEVEVVKADGFASDVEPNLAWTEGAVVATVAGVHALTATVTLDDQPLTASAELSVSAGPAATLNMDLDSRAGTFEVGDRVEVDVHTYDVYGNATRDAWELGAEGGSVELSGDSLVFLEDGEYTITAAVTADTKVSDSVGPFLVDSSGPEISMVFPGRADTTTDPNQPVMGTIIDPWAGVMYSSLNGDALSLDTNGLFQVTTGWKYGLNVVSVDATDFDGNSSDTTQALLCCDFHDPESVVTDGFVVHLAEGAGGLDAVVGGVDTAVSAIDLSSSLPIEMTASKYELAITGVSYEFGGVNLYPTSGALVVETTLTDLVVDIDGRLKAGAWIDAGGQVTVDEVAVLVELTPSVSGLGSLQVRVAESDVDISDLELDFDSSLFAIMDSMGVDVVIESYITDMLEEQVSTQIEAIVRTQVQSALNSLKLDQTVNVMGKSFDLGGRFTDVEVNSHGLTVAMSLSIEGEEALPDRGMAGSLYAGYVPPSMNSLGGLSAGINLDLLNQLLYYVWAEGTLDQTVPSENLGLNTESLQLVFPGVESVTFTTEALLPPVLLPGSLTTPLEAQLGALQLTITDQDDLVLVDMYVSVIMDLDIDVEGGDTLVPSIALDGEPWVDVGEVGGNSTGIIDYASLVELLVPQLVDGLAETIQAVPIPSMDGASYTISRISPYGADGGYLSVVGSLEVGD